MNIFKSFEEYESWTETFENASDYQEIPTLIDDGWKISVDMFTACKSWKTAVRRFAKVFSGYNEDVACFIEGMKESAENGCFSDCTGCMPAWNYTQEEKKEYQKNGTYSWGIEETADGYWYMFLNISGMYASRGPMA